MQRNTREFPLSWQERNELMQCKPLTSSQLVDVFNMWNLHTYGLILWHVNNTGKNPSRWTKKESVYIFPVDMDSLVQDLAEISLGNTILMLKYSNYEFTVYVGRSGDGSTNIDADVIDVFTHTGAR